MLTGTKFLFLGGSTAFGHSRVHRYGSLIEDDDGSADFQSRREEAIWLATWLSGAYGNGW